MNNISPALDMQIARLFGGTKKDVAPAEVESPTSDATRSERRSSATGRLILSLKR